MDDEIDDLGIIGRQKLFAQDLTGHPAEALIASTVRIEGKQSNNKISVGTGFMYDFLFRKIAESRYWSITAIVTNKHVVKDTVSGNFFINQMNEQKNCMFGKKLEFNFQKYRDSWIEHPDNNVDLCILPIGSQIDKLNKNSTFPFIVHNTNEITPSEAEWNLLNPLEDIVMIGYPNGLWDEAIYPGTSGAPVFAYSYGMFPEPGGATSIGSRLKLLGILFKWAKYNTTGGVITQFIPTHDRPVVESRIFMSNLGRVIKSTRLQEFEPILEQRLTAEQRKLMQESLPK
jgi:hypothetical protein